MGWIIAALISLLIAILVLPVWPYSHGWTLYPSGIFAFFAFLCFAVSIFGRRGGPLWKDRGQG